MLLVLVFGSPAHANLPQRHILDASINLGWVTETLAREGRTPENQADLALGMALAEAHVRALISLLRAPYQELDFSGVLDALRRWDAATAGISASHAAAYVRGIHQRFREVLAVYFDARTQRLVRDSNCDSHFADVGFHFGRAHIAGLRGDADAMTGHPGNMRQAIRGGLQQDELKLCGFGVRADWDLAPVLRGDTSWSGFGTSLPVVQEIALRAAPGGGRAALPPARPQGGLLLWERIGDADCPGNDVGTTAGAFPDAAMTARAITAVCWDGVRYQNLNQPGVAFCTYNDVEADQCVGGGNTGMRYRVVRLP